MTKQEAIKILIGEITGIEDLHIDYVEAIKIALLCIEQCIGEENDRT